MGLLVAESGSGQVIMSRPVSISSRQTRQISISLSSNVCTDASLPKKIKNSHYFNRETRI